MTTSAAVVLASSQEDADAVEAVRAHHAELAAGLTIRVRSLATAAASAESVDVRRADLAAYCAQELLPHALAEEVALYPAAAGIAELRLLVEAMIDEHRAIQGLVGEISTAGSTGGAAAAGRALLALFEVHLTKENDLLVPRLAADPAVSLAALLGGMHSALGEAPPAGPAGPTPAPAAPAVVPAPAPAAPAVVPAPGGCGCGGHDEALPELDVRAIPHAIRHATVFGAFDAIAPGSSMVLVAPHDPLPLLRQLSDRADGRLAVTYLERGPESWKLQLTR